MSRLLQRNILVGVTAFWGFAVAEAGASPERPGLVAPALSPSERALLAQEVARAREEDPAAFARLRAVKGFLPSSYRRTRGRKPEVSCELRALGKPALMPLLEALALTGFPTEARLSDGERAALEVGLLDAVGRLRDPRSAPVLREALLHGDEPHVLHGAAIGLGRMCGADGSSGEHLLVAQSRHSEPRRAAAIDGLGECRRIGATERLAAILDEGRSPDETSRAARALATAGSSWAWASGSAGDVASGEKIRATAAAALVRSAAHASGAPLEELTRALSTVDHPSTPSLIAAARAALRSGTDDARQRGLLDEVERAWTHQHRR